MFTIVALTFSSLQAIHLDPERIQTKQGSWRRNNTEKYDDYTCDGKTLFRVLEKWSPCVNCLLLEAKQSGQNLLLKKPGHVFFASEQDILKSFEVKRKTKRKKENLLLLDPKSLHLTISINDAETKYLISITNNDAAGEITKSVYGALLLAKDLALYTDQSLKLNLTELFKADANLAACVLVVRKIMEGQKCVICLDKVKNILLEPCHHLCACDDCIEKINNKCPICRADVKNKIKVYQ